MQVEGVFSNLRDRIVWDTSPCDDDEDRFQFPAGCEIPVLCVVAKVEEQQQQQQPPGYLRNDSVGDITTIKTSTTRKQTRSCKL